MTDLLARFRIEFAQLPARNFRPVNVSFAVRRDAVHEHIRLGAFHWIDLVALVRIRLRGIEVNHRVGGWIRVPDSVRHYERIVQELETSLPVGVEDE